MPRLKHVNAFIVVLASAACGGAGSAPVAPSATPTTGGPQTLTFMGSASISSSGGCSGAVHRFTTGAGTLTVTPTESSASRIALQVCHPTAVNHAEECTVPPFATPAVGEPVSAQVRGGSAQNLTIFPFGCGSPAVAATVTYTVKVGVPD